MSSFVLRLLAVFWNMTISLRCPSPLNRPPRSGRVVGHRVANAALPLLS